MPLTVVENPLVLDYLARIRDAQTATSDFTSAMSHIVRFMLPTVFADLRTREVNILTPVGAATVRRLDEQVVAVPVLRAGLGLLEPLTSAIPEIRVSFLDINRNEDTLMPMVRREWLPPDFGDACVVVLDPMLATGGTLAMSVRLVKERGAKRIKTISIVAAPEGIGVMVRDHPDVQVYVAAVDSHLNDRGYIVPGLGDAGDRLTGFGLTTAEH